MLSLFRANKDMESITVYIISNDISPQSKRMLNVLAERFEREIVWIDFEEYRSRLVLDMEWQISLSAYARLFLTDMLPATCERVLYLDCDTVVCGPLDALWGAEMHGCSVAGVEDLVLGEFKERIGLSAEAAYYNSGVLLIDLAHWRKDEALARFLQFIERKNGCVAHHDQGVINGVLSGEFMRLAPRYNAMTPFFTFHYNNLLTFYQVNNYYEKKEISEAKRHPAIIHYTPEFVGRPWEFECKHPKAELYREALAEAGFQDGMVHGERAPLKYRILYWMYKKAPVGLLRILFRRSK